MTERLPDRFSGTIEHCVTVELFRGLSADPTASKLVKVANLRLVQLPHRAWDRPARFV